MDEQLPGGLGHVQVVLEELVDRGQGLIVQVVGYIVAENLIDEDPAQVHRQLIDQTADSQRAVRHHIPLRIEYLSHVQRHLGFLVGLRHVLQLLHHRSDGHLHVQHGLRVHHAHDDVRDLQKRFICIVRLQRLDQDDAALVHGRDIVPGMAGEHALQELHHHAVLLQLRLHQEDHPGHCHLYVELLGPVVDIHQKQVVQQEVLEEVVPVEPFLVGDDKVLQLAHRNLPHHVHVLAGTLGN